MLVPGRTRRVVGEGNHCVRSSSFPSFATDSLGCLLRPLVDPLHQLTRGSRNSSETTMQKWKADFDLKNSSSAVLSPATSTSPAPQVGESRTLEELRQVQA